MVIRIFALCLLSVTALADWTATDDKQFVFEATFEGDALLGEFKTFSVRFDPDSPELVVDVVLSDADFGDEDMNAVLFDDAWFGSDHPVATYRATDITDDGDGGFTAVGMLDLKGVEAEVTVPFSWNPDTGKMTGEFMLDRTRFDVGSGEWSSGDSIGLDVSLSFDITLAQ